MTQPSVVLFKIVLTLLLIFSTNQISASSFVCPGTSSPNDGFKYCGRYSSEQLKTSILFGEQRQQQTSTRNVSMNNYVCLPSPQLVIDEETQHLNNFNSDGNDLSKYFNSTNCLVRWSDDAVITYQHEICAVNIYSKTFYVISDGYNVHRFTNLSELQFIGPNYFVNHEIETSQTSTFEDQGFIISGPNYVLNMKNDIISTGSKHSPNIFIDTTFHFYMINVGEDDQDGPGVILKSVQSGLCVTTYSKLRFYFKGEPCSNALTFKQAQMTSDTQADLYSRQKFFWTGSLLFSSLPDSDNYLQSISITTSLFSSPYLKYLPIQQLHLIPILNQSSTTETFYENACLTENYMQHQFMTKLKQQSFIPYRYSSSSCEGCFNRFMWMMMVVVGMVMMLMQ
ncbi:hypothetical protein FDP41_007844 [Naegleria fowleri]|uniref:Uncharacterized protein n=1 Tax=Naegleria fowleri TaxID=5763 RepID=A0A6A5CF37_NAEFO|nr:uncharacterized protein FDP41_007844 [Naegleria fowleri]KAF0983929.1 hypothetical protein FDP41_007844 [Naegleria fowleri]